MSLVGKKGCVWFDSGRKAQRISIFRGLIKSLPSFIFQIFPQRQRRDHGFFLEIRICLLLCRHREKNLSE